MTPAQRARLVGFNASLNQRGVCVTVQAVTKNFTAKVLVEPVTEKTREQLQIADDQVSHIVHAKRDDLAAQQVSCQSIGEIERGDCEQTYRVQHFRDDAQRPAILFFCVLA